MVMLMPQKAGAPRPYRALGEAVAEARRRAGITQWDLADAAHISRSYPGLIERGLNRPDPDVLRRIARVLNADYAELAILAGYADAADGDDADMPGWLRQHVDLLKRLPREAADVVVSNARNIAELTGRLTRVDVREEMRRDHEARDQANHQTDE